MVGNFAKRLGYGLYYNIKPHKARQASATTHMLQILPISETTVDHHEVAQLIQVAFGNHNAMVHQIPNAAALLALQVEWELQDPTCRALSTVALDGSRLVGARITVDRAISRHTRPWPCPVPMGDWGEFMPTWDSLEAKGIKDLGVADPEQNGVVADLFCAGVDQAYASRGLYHKMTVASLEAARKMGFSHAIVLTASAFTAKACGGRLGFRPAARMSLDDWRRPDGTKYVVVEPPHNELIVWVRDLEHMQ
ncbi:hypothetical protein Pelo_4728 [Pelomyxa schiedti]|nr:hypothetical protein Pelo_4728 [Pelomyxa schiedti]